MPHSDGSGDREYFSAIEGPVPDATLLPEPEKYRESFKDALLDTVRMDLDAGPRAKPGYKGGGFCACCADSGKRLEVEGVSNC